MLPQRLFQLEVRNSMAAKKLTEKLYEWDNGFSIMTDSARTVVCLVIGGQVMDYYSYDVTRWYPEDVEQKWIHAYRVLRRARYVDTKYASGIVISVPPTFLSEGSDPVRCVYLSKNPRARHLMARTSDNEATLIAEIENFRWPSY